MLSTDSCQTLSRTRQTEVVREHPLDHEIQDFSTSMVLQAMKACSNSKATGPMVSRGFTSSIWGLGASNT